MTSLDIALMGPPQIARDGHPVPRPYAKVLGLLAYLAVEAEHPQPRSTLAAMLWPHHPEDRARHNLRQSLTSLRAIVEPGSGAPVLRVDRETIGLDRHEHLLVDVHRVRALMDERRHHSHADPAHCLPCTQRLERAAALSRGAFLDGFSIPESETFEEWLSLWRQRLQQESISVFEALVGCYERQGEAEGAVTTLRRQLELDPYQEAAHRRLMTLLWRDGNRAAALAHYDACRALLEEELAVEPEAETQALARMIREGASPPGREVSASTRPAPRVRIPAPPGRLLGREREMEEIVDLLANQECRLLTLHGPGGCGKTRLAIEVARRYADASDRTTAFVPLGGVIDADGVVQAIAQALGLALRDSGEAEPHLLGWMRELSMFLVLDNAEHLVDDLGVIATMLVTVPDVTILVTSRERIGVAGEWLYELDGLAYPRSTSEDSPEGYGAMALLAERARQVRSGAPLPHAERPDLVRICQLVEGMPLAIEMAASWANTLTPAQIADAIRENRDFLASASPRGIPDRHHSMRAVFRSSWDRLTPDQQATFRRLSVFEQGFGLDAARQVTGATAASLAALVNASLVGRAPSGRYRLHSLLAQFAGELLRRNPAEHRELRTRHARYYLTLVASQEELLLGRDQPTALRTITDDLANIQAAWGWAISTGDVASLLDALRALWLFFVIRGWMSAGSSTFGALLDAFRRRALPGDSRRDVLAAMACLYTGGFRSGLGRYDEGIALLEEGLSQLRPLVSGRLVGLALNMLAAARVMKGEYDAARECLHESLREFERIHDTWGIAFALNDLGMISHVHFDDDTAERDCERSRSMFRQVGDIRGQALAAHNLGVIASQSGALQRAAHLHREALALQEETEDRWGIGISLVQLGMVTGMLGSRAVARGHLLRALRIAWESSIVPVVLQALTELAALDIAAGQLDTARTALTAVARHPAVHGQVRGRCETLMSAIDERIPPVAAGGTDDLWAIRTVDDLARASVA